MTMKVKLAAGALGLALAASPAVAQHEGHGPPAEPRPVPAGDRAAEEAPPAGQLHPEAMTGALGPYPTTREARARPGSRRPRRIAASMSPPATGR